MEQSEVKETAVEPEAEEKKPAYEKKEPEVNSITGKIASPKEFVDMSAVPTNSIKMITPKSMNQIKQIR